MSRLLVLGCVAAVAVLLVFHRPPAPAAAITVAPSQDARKGHPLAARAQQSNIIIYIVGAVHHPGLYAVSANARVNDAVERAGGLLSSADPAAINLAEHVTDGAEIRVLRIGETASAPPQRHVRSRKTRARTPAADIDINTADTAALASLPGVGETLAARIVEFRGLNGPFASLDELADVAGMTQRRIDAIAPYLRVTGAR